MEKVTNIKDFQGKQQSSKWKKAETNNGKGKTTGQEQISGAAEIKN